LYTQFLGLGSAFFSELVAAMIALELATAKGFPNIWLETDSQLVFLAFKSRTMVPWKIRNRWNNCRLIIKNMGF